MKYKNVWLKTAGILSAIGIVIVGISFAALGFDFRRLRTSETQTTNKEVGEEFQNISIQATVESIRFLPSEDGKSRVVIRSTDRLKHEIVTGNDALSIHTRDERGWFSFIGFLWESPEIAVYLPKREYESLEIEISTGNVEIPNDLEFKSMRIDGSTGNVTSSATVQNGMEIHLSTGNIFLKDLRADDVNLSTTTGNIRAESVHADQAWTAEVSTGNIDLGRISAAKLTSTGSTGSILLRDVDISGEMVLERSTGNIVFEKSDAASILAKTDTGDIRGTLRTGKMFQTDTSTGEVKVPVSSQGGWCKLTTSTGNIQIEVE